MSEETETLQELADRKYKYGFVSEIESDFEVRRQREISARRANPLRVLKSDATPQING